MLHAIMKGQLVSWGIYSFSREKCLIFKLKKKTPRRPGPHSRTRKRRGGPHAMNWRASWSPRAACYSPWPKVGSQPNWQHQNVSSYCHTMGPTYIHIYFFHLFFSMGSYWKGWMLRWTLYCCVSTYIIMYPSITINTTTYNVLWDQLHGYMFRTSRSYLQAIKIHKITTTFASSLW